MHESAITSANQAFSHSWSSWQFQPRRQSGRLPVSNETDAALVELLYDTVGNPSGWTTFLQALTEDSYFNRAALHGAAPGGGDISAQVNFDEAALESYSRYYAALNPWLATPVEYPSGVVLTTDHVISYADLVKTEYHQDWCRPQGFDIAVGVNVLQDDVRSMSVFAVGRRTDLERDQHIVGRLRRLATHLLRVAQLNQQLGGLETRTVAAELALDRLTTAMIVVNRSGQVVHMNGAARRIIANNDGLSIINKKLTAANQDQCQDLRRLVGGALRATKDIAAIPGGVTRITRRSEQGSYEILVTPLSENTVAPGFCGPLAAVFIRDPEAKVTVSSDWLQRLYGVTGAESRLMNALLSGDTLDTSAERFAVSKETLRSQLKSIFLKTGTSSQIELIRLGLRGLAAFQG
jgi:DNA-binding CsgD family transcriptional regulator/PAS domain-containing protein